MIYGYARVSTDRQENSAEAQTSRLMAHCHKSGLPFGEVFVDQDQSAYRIPLKQRLAGKRLCDALSPGDTLVFTKLDRCFRSLQDQVNTLSGWEAIGIKVVILDMPIQYDDPYGRCTLAVIGSAAQLSSELTGQRIREVNSYLKAAGKPYGAARPLGWMRKGREYVPCDEERKTGATVVRMRAAGSTWSAIALHLCMQEVLKPCRRRGSRGYYSESDVQTLHRAASNGYPRIPPKVWRADWSGGLQRAAESAARSPAAGA
ncbi:MAG: recombinase family protein [Caulobacteraceae bacterium]|nr:recombinase family protein [Caulobacteraceae bacterium]